MPIRPFHMPQSMPSRIAPHALHAVRGPCFKTCYPHTYPPHPALITAPGPARTCPPIADHISGYGAAALLEHLRWRGLLRWWAAG
jgi:hypothetical protein